MWGKTMEDPCRLPKGGRRLVPNDVRDLYEGAYQGCTSNEECLVMAKLLCVYKVVFSSGDHDLGLTQTVCHEIPLAAGTLPIRQSMGRLGPKKEKEVS